MYVLRHVRQSIALDFEDGTGRLERPTPQHSHYGLPFYKLEFFGPQMALAYRLDAISQGPKNSRFPGPNPLPLALVMDLHASKKLRTVPYKS
jgi:hypothetical protein